MSDHVKKTPWYENVWAIIICGIIFPPLAIYLVYKWAERHLQEFIKAVNSDNDTYTYI